MIKMSGLIEKDLRLLFQRKQTLAIFLGIAVVLGFAEGGIFIIGYLSFLCMVLMISTINYDEFDNGYAFLLTLPITRKTYVIEKYILCSISNVISWLVAVILSVIINQIQTGGTDNMENLFVAACILPTPFVMMTIMIPVQLKFGAEKSRVVMFLTFGVIAVIIYGTKRLMDSMGVDVSGITEQLDNIPAGIVIAAIILITIIAIAISYAISVKIMENKKI